MQEQARGGEQMENTNTGMPTHMLCRNRQEEVSRWRILTHACQLTNYAVTSKRRLAHG